MPFTVCVPRSERDGRYSIGQTGNLERRLRMHELGLVEFTRHRRPLVLVYRKDWAAREEAQAREGLLKRQKGGRNFNRMISNDPG